MHFPSRSLSRLARPAPITLAAFFALALTACAEHPFPTATQANNARSYDPWLDGEPCSADPEEIPKLQPEEVVVGTGKVFEEGDTVRAHYVAWLPDGTKLHDSHLDGPPIEVILGSTHVICGFERALLGMRAGGQRRVTIPWAIAFGEQGRSPDIGPKTDVVLVVDGFVPAATVIEKHSAPSNPARGGGGRRR